MCFVHFLKNPGLLICFRDLLTFIKKRLYLENQVFEVKPSCSLNRRTKAINARLTNKKVGFELTHLIFHGMFLAEVDS